MLTRSLVERAQFDRILRARAINAVFQPIVDLESGQTVAYEALARGPTGTPFVDPARLFAEGYRSGRVAELDCACRAATYQAALAAGLGRELPLFVNAEPVSLGSPCPNDVRPILEDAEQRLCVVLELTERALVQDPAGLLRAVDAAREQSIGVALDDVGADPGSLAMMPLIHPDAIKLDLRLLHERPTPLVARVANAVLAEAERTGAAIIAEGIENLDQVAQARSMGATLGQGWYFGRPGPLPTEIRPPNHELVFHRRPATSWRTPFGVLNGRLPVKRADKYLLERLSLHLEYKGFDLAEASVILGAFQHVRHFTNDIRARYGRLAARGGLVAAMAEGMPLEPWPGVRGGPIGHADPLRDEWVVIMIGPHFSVAMAARDLGDTGPEPLRRFDYVLTHDRALAIEAAQALIQRIQAAPTESAMGIETARSVAS